MNYIIKYIPIEISYFKLHIIIIFPYFLLKKNAAMLQTSIKNIQKSQLCQTFDR